MQKDSTWFDDITKLASNALGTAGDMKRELEAMVLDKCERVLARMHLVRREEYEVLKGMMDQFRLEQEYMKQKLAEMEKRLESKETSEEPVSKRTKK